MSTWTYTYKIKLHLVEQFNSNILYCVLRLCTLVIIPPLCEMVQSIDPFHKECACFLHKVKSPRCTHYTEEVGFVARNQGKVVHMVYGPCFVTNRETSQRVMPKYQACVRAVVACWPSPFCRKRIPLVFFGCVSLFAVVHIFASSSGGLGGLFLTVANPDLRDTLAEIDAHGDAVIIR